MSVSKAFPVNKKDEKGCSKSGDASESSSSKLGYTYTYSVEEITGCFIDGLKSKMNSEGNSHFLSYDDLKLKMKSLIDSVKDLQEGEKIIEVTNFLCLYLIDTKNPNFLSKLYFGGLNLNLLADMLISYFNTAVHVYSASSVFTVAENQILNKLIGYLGYDTRTASGLFYPGGSYCNLVGLISARHSKYPEAKEYGIAPNIKVIASVNCHYSIEKSMIMMGMGTKNLIKLNFDLLSKEEFEDILRQNNVLLVVSTFGTTSHGTLENLDKFQNLLRKYNVWHHVDACQGATLLLSSKYRHLTSSLQYSDSITLDFHKGISLSQQCSCVIVKDGTLLSGASSTKAPYLFHEDDKYDISNRSFQCGRRADGFKLWLADLLIDLDVYSTKIYDNIAELKSVIRADNRFTIRYPDSLSHVCFTVTRDPSCDLHQIISRLRDEGIFLEYYQDYIRIVAVNLKFGVNELRAVLDKIDAACDSVVEHKALADKK